MGRYFTFLAVFFEIVDVINAVIQLKKKHVKIAREN
jgi:hypothetical protein